MNNKIISFAVRTISAFVLLSAAALPVAAADVPAATNAQAQPNENAVVKAAGDNGLKFLQAFNSQFREVLKQKGLPAGELQCVGCDVLEEKEGQKPPTELSYFFPATTNGFAGALIQTWIMDPVREDGWRLTFRPPVCSNYPIQPCYSRPTCSGGTTPYCRTKPTGSCLTTPSCLP